MLTKLPYPKFLSESEEAEWLYEHRNDLDHYFSPLNVSVREMLLRDHDLVLQDQVISVPLSQEDIVRATTMAASAGVPPEEYLSRVLHEALKTKQAA